MGEPLANLDDLRTRWKSETGASRRRFGWAALALGGVAAMLVGRVGMPGTRAAAAAVLLFSALPLVVMSLLERERRRSDRALMQATLLRTQPKLAEAALRAVDLKDRTEADEANGSEELARYHLARLMQRVSLPRLEQRLSGTAWFGGAIGLLLAAVALVVVMLDPLRPLEGANVLLARDGQAPLDFRWVELPRISREAPVYLGLPRAPLQPYFPAKLAHGSEVTFRVEPRYHGRDLVLRDGQRAVPFVADGEGALVARWTVQNDAKLRVAARFGEVFIDEPNSLEIHAVPDHAPHVTLQGAPKRYLLMETERIPVHWEALDDHGIREVALVLRSGEKEARRSLSKPQGGVASDRGGIDLIANDPFIQKSFLPIEVTVQAQDNDPLRGPKWGVSDPIFLLPPELGEAAARRYRALADARNMLTDLLAARLRLPLPATAARTDRAPWVTAQVALYTPVDEHIGALLDRGKASVGSDPNSRLEIPAALRGLVEGQREQLRAVLAKAGRASSKQANDELIDVTEKALLACDSALDALDSRDGRRVAAKMVDVAVDLVEAIQLTAEPDHRSRAQLRMTADIAVLRAGGKNMLKLGRLGGDLGEIVGNHLGRVERAWAASDRHHAWLAAEDLLARLRQPQPSFGSSGGHGHGGVESGSGQGGQGQGEGKASEAAEQAKAVQDALRALREEHASQMDAVQKALEDGLSDDQRSQMQDELDKMAQNVRDAVSQMPEKASAPDSARASAAQARSQGESMAEALGRGDLKRAGKLGRQALESLKQAQRTGGDAADGSPEGEIGRAAGAARSKLEKQLKAAERALAKQRKQASEGARAKLKEVAEAERKLAERADKLRRQSRQSEAPLPQAMLERLRQAAQEMGAAADALDRAQGKTASEKQKRAQQLLDMSQPESDEPQDGDGDDGGNSMAQKADVPEEQRDQQAKDFRRRVTDGLGRPVPPHLDEALRRYTEGLLR